MAEQRGIERYKYGNFMLLRCTQKFLTELRLKKSDIIEASAVAHPLNEWYAHVFYLYPRRKCAIFMHAGTKFCFFAYDRNREQLTDIKGLFCKGLGRALFDEHYSAPVIKLFSEHLEGIQIGLAKDRRIQHAELEKFFATLLAERRDTGER